VFDGVKVNPVHNILLCY